MKVRSIITAGQNTMRWARRVRYLVAEHWSARIVARANAQEYVVDSWFFDLGTPAVVMPLAAWRAGEEPLAIQVSRP